MEWANEKEGGSKTGNKKIFVAKKLTHSLAHSLRHQLLHIMAEIVC